MEFASRCDRSLAMCFCEPAPPGGDARDVPRLSHAWVPEVDGPGGRQRSHLLSNIVSEGVQRIRFARNACCRSSEFEFLAEMVLHCFVFYSLRFMWMQRGGRRRGGGRLHHICHANGLHCVTGDLSVQIAKPDGNDEIARLQYTKFARNSAHEAHENESVSK